MRGDGSSYSHARNVGELTDILSGFAFKSDLFTNDPNLGMPLIRIRDLKSSETACRYIGEYRPLSPEAAMAMREEENRVILKPVLVEALETLNGIGAADAEAIYSELSTLSDNEEWQRKLRGAYSRRLAGEARDRPITLIDFKHPDRNSYHVVRQFRVAAQRARIADIVVFVNGIPLVVIEAKSPLKATARADEAFEQIKQYERDIPRLFHSNAFNLVTDGMRTEYGATGSPSQFYARWPDAWPRSRDEFADDQVVLRHFPDIVAAKVGY